MNESVLPLITPETPSTSLLQQPAPHYQWGLDFMLALRVIWYLFCFTKIIAIAFFTRPKPSIRERVLRKILISHSELLRSFNDEDKQAMEVIVDNTIKNASSKHESQNSRIRKSLKRVNFQVQKNDYYEPKEWKQEQPVFYDVISSDQHPIQLHQNTSFEEKKLQEEFIEREDLLGLNEKSQELEEKKQQNEEEAVLTNQEGERSQSEVKSDELL